MFGNAPRVKSRSEIIFAAREQHSVRKQRAPAEFFPRAEYLPARQR
jgi:hypothetical protein